MNEELNLIDSPKLNHKTSKYSVTVVRTRHEEFEIALEAKSEREAEDKAIELAKDENHGYVYEEEFETSATLIGDAPEEMILDDPNQLYLFDVRNN